MSTDVIQRFSFTNAPIRGQWVRLESALADLFANRDYPTPIQTLLAEMLAAVSLMADGIKFQGAVALQARGTGPVTTVLAECRARHLVRGIARWAEETDLDPESGDLADLLGSGQMAVSLLPDTDEQGDMPNYQGFVSLDAGSLAASLEQYFESSEQLPTRLFLVFDGRRVTGLLLQRLPARPSAGEMELEEHQALWEEALLLARTLRPQELAMWTVAELLTKLFYEHPVALQPGRTIEFACTCSRERAERMLTALPKSEILEVLAERGVVDVTCEICGARYEYDQIDTRFLYEPEPPRVH